MKKRHHAKAKPSRDYHRSALTMVLVFRDDLDALNLDSLHNMHGLPVSEIERMIATEKQRRADYGRV